MNGKQSQADTIYEDPRERLTINEHLEIIRAVLDGEGETAAGFTRMFEPGEWPNDPTRPL